MAFLGKYIRERYQRLFNTLGGNYDEVQKWKGRSCFEYYLYLERLKAYLELQKNRTVSRVKTGGQSPFSGK